MMYAAERHDPLVSGFAPILNEDCAAVVVTRPVVNIDDPFELELAEWLLMRQTQAVPQLALADTA